MMKKTLAVLMTAALAASCLTACGGSDEAKSQAKKDSKDSSGEITLKVFDAHAYGLDEYAEMAKSSRNHTLALRLKYSTLPMTATHFFSHVLTQGISRMCLTWSPEHQHRNIMNTLMTGRMTRKSWINLMRRLWRQEETLTEKSCPCPGLMKIWE